MQTGQYKNEGTSSPIYTYNASSSVNPGALIDLTILSGMIGSQAKISIPYKQVYLHLREVEIYGIAGVEAIILRCNVL